ncbi:phosphodiester glycosidase family protein [Actinacidiphila acidipaludis]|uniref:Phosphodiester glycosidase family protein n=1 Tax=Actinacidiphila acidipaludis TaxID=2873382 RepID=A0ABS7Q6N1_9ACTN|nr:phosphodiester glycosidase family protein [Streptomyces acidipaludis]MBY8878798.1 phosphodiester glycosidase family protein [Streptomyces acidipaludis]
MTQGGQIAEPQEETGAGGSGGGRDGTRRRRRRLLPWKHRRDLDPAQLRRRRITVRSLLAVTLVCLGTLGWSVGRALTYPGKDSTTARLAEWARDHELGFVVDKLEDWQYRMNPPKVGGTLSPDALARMNDTAPATPSPAHIAAQPLIPLRAPMTPMVSPGLPGEGVYRTLASAHGEPVVQGTYVRPDSEHTSYEAAVAWISGKYARFQLHPGFREPGGTFDVPPTIPKGQRTGLVATWNGGFRITDGGSRGGFYLDGRTAGELRDGAASEVFYRDGSMKLGVWGRDVRMTPDVVGVRQCLELMVDNGRVVPDIDDASKWGVSDQSKMFVPRSGVGVTAQGDIVMVVGQALDARSLAALMQRAGAVRAMPLDMNRAWPSFMSYDGSKDPADPKPTNILDFEDPPDRYYVQATRDFVAVYAR